MTVATFDPNHKEANDKHLVSVSNSALAHFKRVLQSSDQKVIRLSTKVSGCSGYAYILEPVAAIDTTDIVIELPDNMTLAVAVHARELVKDTEIDYVTQGINGEIRFNNPNVVNECGCGESFNVG